MDIHYCFNCGSHLVESLLPTEERLRLNCPACGHIHYVNPKVVCGTLPLQDGKVWLLRRGIEPRLGFWTHPAGFQEIDETTEEGALRETLEEMGCRVALDGLLGVYSRPHAPVNVVYLAHVLPDGGLPRTTVEAVEVRAFAPDELPWGELAFISTARALEEWVKRAGNRSQIG
jgi:ADP-ribose pyrophosphatase YjhB (NUDIX family)